MTRLRPLLTGLCAVTLLGAAGCDRAGDEPTAGEEMTAEPAAALPEGMSGRMSEQVAEGAAAALPPVGDIPYPLYPNGARYRVGGENGLRIVVFETDDSFDEVDAYYSERADEGAMPRLRAMSDYVRYATADDDRDPWGTHRPGIVIHRFEDDAQRAAVGAGSSARTNIIMSF